MRTTLLAAIMVMATGSLIASCGSSDVPPPAPLTTEAPEPVLPPVASSEPVTPPPTTTTTTQAPAPPPVVVPKPVVPPPIATQAPAPPPVIPKPVPPPVPPPPPAGVYYKNCDAARAAGAAPLRVGEPGYRKGLDRDNDGVACE